MSRLWITARPSVSSDLMPYRRKSLRWSYRVLRSSGLDRHEARMLISSVLYAARQEGKP